MSILGYDFISFNPFEIYEGDIAGVIYSSRIDERG